MLKTTWHPGREGPQGIVSLAVAAVAAEASDQRALTSWFLVGWLAMAEPRSLMYPNIAQRSFNNMPSHATRPLASSFVNHPHHLCSRRRRHRRIVSGVGCGDSNIAQSRRYMGQLAGWVVAGVLNNNQR